MNVLIIPEDFRKDQYILKPILEAMLAAVGKPQAKVGRSVRTLCWEE